LQRALGGEALISRDGSIPLSFKKRNGDVPANYQYAAIFEGETNYYDERGIHLAGRESRCDLFMAAEHGPDPHVETVRDLLLSRSRVGIAKYGTTTARTDLSRIAWLKHAREEALDLAVYLTRIIDDEESQTTPTTNAK